MPACCPAPVSSVLATLCTASLGARATSPQAPAPMFPDLAGTRWLNIWRQGWCSVPMGGFSAQRQPGESGLHAVCVSEGGGGRRRARG